MGAAIRTRIVRIGNSQGIRIPKPLLEQSGIHTEVEIEVHGDQQLFAQHHDYGLDGMKLFAAMAERQDDVLLDDINTTDWDRVEWEW